MLQDFFRLAIYIPITETDDRSNPDVASTDAVQVILEIFRGCNFAGRVGAYDAVAEISRGAETFVPTTSSSPTQGEVGVPSNVETARLVTYIPTATTREALDRLLEEIASAHPWEHPVLEVDLVSLWMPS
jgi:hypothetical protein